MAAVTLGGNPIGVAGTFPKPGDQAPDFSLATKDLKDVSLAEYAGKRKVLNIVPSLDTPVCAKSTREFNRAGGQRSRTRSCSSISADLPFAMNRFCSTEGLNNVVTLSTFRGRDFHGKYGVDITDGAAAGPDRAGGGGAGREQQGPPFPARARDQGGARLRRGARGAEVTSRTGRRLLARVMGHFARACTAGALAALCR